jgi:hypothetical protein
MYVRFVRSFICLCMRIYMCMYVFCLFVCVCLHDTYPLFPKTWTREILVFLELDINVTAQELLMAVFFSISGKSKVNEQLNLIFFSPLFVQNPSFHYGILCASSLNCGTKTKSFYIVYHRKHHDVMFLLELRQIWNHMCVWYLAVKY